MTSISELLLFAPESFPAHLATAQIDETVEDLIKLKPIELAKLLVAKQVSTNSTAIADANTVRDFFLDCLGKETQTSGATAVAVSMPTPQVTVNIPKDFDKMVLSEALAFVNANKSDQGLQLQLLERIDIKKAILLSGTQAIFASSAVGSIDADATMAVVSGLLNSDPYQQSYNGVFLLTLGMALGTQVFQFKHPFDGTKLASSKIDSLGINFGKTEFTAEIFEAFVWLQSKPETVPAQLVQEIAKTGHAFLYNDATTNGFLVTQLLSHFRHARNTLRLPAALAVDVIYREEAKTEKKSDSDKHSIFNGDVLSRLRAVSEGSESFSGARRIQCGIYTTISASGASYLHNLIVLDGGSCSGASHGTIFVPHGTRINQSGASSVVVNKRSPEELFALAQSWDLI